MSATTSDANLGVMPDSLEECHALIRKQQAEIADLKRKLEKNKRMLFDKKSANVSVEDLTPQAKELHEQMKDQLKEELDKRGKSPKPKEEKHGGGGNNAPAQAPNQRTLEHRIDDSQRFCTCCGTQTLIRGFTKQSELEVIKWLFQEVVHIVFKYYCPKCGEKSSADPPDLLFENSYATPSLVTHIGVSKFNWLNPTYRQEQILRAQGIPLSRSQMGRFLKQGADELEIIVKRMNELLLKARVVQADPTKMPLIVEGKGKVHQGNFWQYRSEDERFPYTFYDFTKDGGGHNPARVLKGFENILQTDGAPVFNEVIRGGATQANCAAHAYRYWEDALKSDPERAGVAIAYFKGLYDIEREITDWPEEERKDIRQQLAVPILDKLKSYMDKLAQDPTVTPKSPVSQAVEYCLNRWEPLCLYTKHGFMRPDTNPTEAGHRKIAQGRNSWLFAGSVEGGKTAAIWMTLIQTCNRLGIDPYDYLVDVLTNLRSTSIKEIDKFLPDRWRADRMKESEQKKAS